MGWQSDPVEKGTGTIKRWQLDKPLPGPKTPKGGMAPAPRGYSELRGQGATPEQIGVMLGARKYAKPTVWEMIKDDIGENVGGMAGGITGAKLALLLGQVGPLAALPEEVATIPLAAGLGGIIAGGAGKGIQQAVTPGEKVSLEDMGAAGLRQGLFETGGRFAVQGAKFLFSPFIKKTVPKAVAMVDDFGKAGGHFTPAQIDKRFTIRAGEAVSRGGFGSQQAWKEFTEAQFRQAHQVLDGVIDDVADSFLKNTPGQIGNLTEEMIKRPGGLIDNMFDDLISPLYNQVDEMTKGVGVKTKALKQLALKELKIDQRMVKAGRKGMYLTPTGRDKMAKLLGLQPEIGFGDMRKLRSSFLKDVRKLHYDADPAEGLIKRIAGAADDALMSPASAKKLTPEARRLLTNTNALYKTYKQVGAEVLTEKLAKKVAQNPAGVVHYVFPAGNDKAISAFRGALTQTAKGAPHEEGVALWNQLRAAWLADVVETSSKEGVLNPNTFLRKIQKMGEPALKEMFSPEELKRINKTSDLFRVLKAPAGGSTVLFTKGLQIGGAITLWQGLKEQDVVKITTGGALALGPIAYARLAMHPQGAKLLAAGIKVKPGAGELGPLVGRMVKLLRQLDIKERMQERKFAKRQARKRFQQQQIYAPVRGQMKSPRNPNANAMGLQK